MSILSKLNIKNTEAFGLMVSEPDILDVNGSTTTFRLNKPQPYTGTIQGQNVQAVVTLREAALTRLSHLVQTQKSTGNQYNIVTGIFNPVRFDIELMIDGQKMDMMEVLRTIAEEASNAKISAEEFELNCQKIGFQYRTGMPMFFQQFGANLEEFQTLLEVFKENGAVDVYEQIRGEKRRIMSAYAMPRGNAGIPISSLEVGSMDRTKSERFAYDGIGQGFQNLIDAQFEQFVRIVTLRKLARVKLEEANAAPNADMASLLRSESEKASKMSRQASSTWGGSQQRIVAQANGGFVSEDMFDPANVPCGRFTLDLAGGAREISLWTNKNEQVTAAPKTAVDFKDPF
jgi:hypothetical protein